MLSARVPPTVLLFLATLCAFATALPAADLVARQDTGTGDKVAAINEESPVAADVLAVISAGNSETDEGSTFAGAKRGENGCYVPFKPIQGGDPEQLFYDITAVPSPVEVVVPNCKVQEQGSAQSRVCSYGPSPLSVDTGKWLNMYANILSHCWFNGKNQGGQWVSDDGTFFVTLGPK